MNSSHSRSYLVLLNSRAGALRSAAIDEVIANIKQALAAAAHRDVEVVTGTGRDLMGLLEKHMAKLAPDAVVIGGGDGTVSCAAARLCGTNTALGVLPLGTMNLFARSLGMPLSLGDAIGALGGARRRKVDLGEVDGRVFTHHVSIGLQARLVATRERMDYGSRAGKVAATLAALLMTLRQPPRLALRADIDGTVLDLDTPALVVSNNLYGPDHLPYADALDQGVLGVYACTSSRPADLAILSLEALLGRWHENGCVKVLTARSVSIERRSTRKKTVTATLDGELMTLSTPLTVSIRPRALTVLVPQGMQAATAG